MWELSSSCLPFRNLLHRTYFTRLYEYSNNYWVIPIMHDFEKNFFNEISSIPFSVTTMKYLGIVRTLLENWRGGCEAP